MSYYSVDILTPSRVLAKDLPAESLLVPTVRGEINVLPEHTHVVTKLDTGILTLINNGVMDNFTVTTGFCKVLDKKITILSAVTEHVDEIDRERAEAALKKAQEALKSETLSDHEITKYRRKIDRAEIRLKLALARK